MLFCNCAPRRPLPCLHFLSLAPQPSNFLNICWNRNSKRRPQAYAPATLLDMGLRLPCALSMTLCSACISCEGIAFDRSGHLVVADCGNNVDRGNDRVQVLRYRDGAHVRTIGSKGKDAGQLKHPNGVAVDGVGRIVVCDSGNHRLQVLP